MKVVKIFLSLAFMVGLPQVIISSELLDYGHSLLFTPLSFLNAFIGTALTYGTVGFKTAPKGIGNIDNNKTVPQINQTWAMFFISLIANLTVSNLCNTVLY